MVSQHALQVVSQHALQQVSKGGWYPSMPCRFPGPQTGGELRRIWPGGSPGPHPKGKLRGICLGVSPGPHLGVGGSPGPHPREWLQAHTWGCLQAHTGGGVSRPTPRGVSRPTPRGVYPSMHWSRPPWWLLLQAVRILLECILVVSLQLNPKPILYNASI